MMATPEHSLSKWSVTSTRVAVGIVALHFDDQVYQVVS